MHNEVEESRIMHAHGILSGTEIYVDDTAMLTVQEIRAKTLRLQREQGLDLVLVDYLQLLHGSRQRPGKIVIGCHCAPGGNLFP